MNILTRTVSTYLWRSRYLGKLCKSTFRGYVPSRNSPTTYVLSYLLLTITSISFFFKATTPYPGGIRSPQLETIKIAGEGRGCLLDHAARTFYVLFSYLPFLTFVPTWNVERIMKKMLWSTFCSSVALAAWYRLRLTPKRLELFLAEWSCGIVSTCLRRH
jgi:hypothetical protein